MEVLSKRACHFIAGAACESYVYTPELGTLTYSIGSSVVTYQSSAEEFAIHFCRFVDIFYIANVGGLAGYITNVYTNANPLLVEAVFFCGLEGQYYCNEG